MFHPRKTVFILGAGASWHYGYPTGEVLVEKVRAKAQLAGEYFENLAANANNPGIAIPKVVADSIPIDLQSKPAGRTAAYLEYKRKCTSLFDKLGAVDPTVIDYFLGHNPDVADVGKLMIAWVLLDAEAATGNSNRERSGTGDVKSKDNWYRFIIDKLVSNCQTPQALLDNRVVFITFNYDVSLDKYISNALSSIQFFEAGGVASQFLQQMPILHMYGQIRSDPTSSPEPFTGNIREGISRKNNLYFQEATNLMDVIYKASQGINTIAPSEKLQSSVVKHAEKAIADADRIFILGYGFDEQNSKNLKLRDHLGVDGKKHGIRQREIFFTNFGDINKINKRASRIFFGNTSQFQTGQSIVNSLGCVFEKSVRNVYDALACDFDAPDDE